MNIDKMRELSADMIVKIHNRPIINIGDEHAMEIADALNYAANEIERLQQFERGELIPGKVVTDRLAAAERWIAEEREFCAMVCETMFVPGTPWTDDGGIRAQALVTAAQNIRARGAR